MDDVREKYPCLCSFKEDPNAWRKLAQECFLLENMKEAKKALISILCWAKPKDDNPALWALAAEVRAATALLLALPSSAYLQGMFNDRRVPGASRLSYLLGAEEDAIVQAFAAALRDDRRFCVQTYMFDGVVVATHPDDLADLVEVAHTVGAQHSVRFTTAFFPVESVD